MDISGIILGTAIGVGCMIAKNTLIDAQKNKEAQQMKNEADILSDENEKLRKRIKEAERQIEDLLAENQNCIVSIKRKTTTMTNLKTS